MSEIPAAMLAEADREVAGMKERIGYLVKAYLELREAGRDETRADAWLCANLSNESSFSRIDLSGLLAVAVSMLAETPDPEAVPGRDLLDAPAVAYDPEDPHKPRDGG